MSLNSAPGSAQPEPITEVNVSEISVETTGRLRAERVNNRRWSASALWLGIVSIVLAPVGGIGVLPAVIAIVVGHRAKKIEPQGVLQSSIGLALGYLAIVVGTAVLIFVALPLTLAFLISSGYILAS